MLRAFCDVDPMDALEDYLTRKKGDQIDVPGLLSFLETTECDAASRTHVFRCIGYSPLGYAIRFSPQSVFLYWNPGKMPRGSLQLQAGGDVNMRHSNGPTALHYAALNCKYDSLRELLKGAENEVDWNARTPEGENALELLEMGVSRGLGQTWGFSATQMDDFRSILESHVSRNVSGTCDDADEFSFVIPGSFPRTTS
ncbi:hypothetical protein BC629DRAFT_1589241 [Irpex lacteus]|nr:hypothetical protein BC629DRAFT_1589241 [Irpex lacteus]